MNSKIGTGSTEACPNCGSFMVVATRAKADKSDKQKDDAKTGQSNKASATSQSVKRDKPKKLRCVDCDTKFVPSVAKTHSWKTPIGVFLIILLTGLSVRAVYQFSDMIGGIGSAPDSQSVSGPSQGAGLESSDDAGQNTEERDIQGVNQQPVAENVKDTSTDRATGLYDQVQEIDEPSQAELAQLETELAEHTALSQQQVQRVERSLNNAEQEERMALLRIAVAQALEKWRAAWQSGDIETYLNAYVQDYSPSSDVTNTAWRAQRKYRVTRNLPRQIKLSNFDTQCDLERTQCVVEFDQVFEAPEFSDASRKRLEFIVIGEDDFKISAETSLD